MTGIHAANKALIAPLRAAMADFDAASVTRAMTRLIWDEAVVHMCHPFGDLVGPQAFYDACYAPLLTAMPDLERRDWIVIAGRDDHGHDWVGCAGQYMGSFVAPWLDIPPTGHLAYMRFHEFYRIREGQVVEVQAIWDIPELMMQAAAWPMAPSLGREGCVAAPMTQDGLYPQTDAGDQGTASKRLVLDMLAHLVRHPAHGGPEVMELARFWDPRMNWYGPAGIGSARGIAGFRNWHQIPFLAAMPDRGMDDTTLTYHFFAEGNYVAVTGWPDMRQTITHDGWLGIAPAGQRVELRSLDFWRCASGMIRENWVLVDILDVYRQLGVDVFARLRAFNKARPSGPVPYPVGDR